MIALPLILTRPRTTNHSVHTTAVVKSPVAAGASEVSDEVRALFLCGWVGAWLVIWLGYEVYTLIAGLIF